jgi:hypothetical protein
MAGQKSSKSALQKTKTTRQTGLKALLRVQQHSHDETKTESKAGIMQSCSSNIGEVDIKFGAMVCRRNYVFADLTFPLPVCPSIGS